MGLILFELNEVPFRILDEYRRWHPRSALARTLPRCRQYRTLHEDPVALSPWRTWPTVHRGVTESTHGIRDFGQALGPVDAAYPPLWKLLAASGISTGVCGSLHTSPMPSRLDGYRFYLPDAFAAGSECFPEHLVPMHAFNLDMSRRSMRNVASGIPWGPALRVLVAAPGLGIKPRTWADVGSQLVSERAARWRRTRRRTLQAMLSFDVFEKELVRGRPDFATFFTNHVAAAMHRYWAAAFPEDFAALGFDRAWVETYREEIGFAMSRFDRMLGRLVRHVDRHPGTALWVVTSMGQAASRGDPVRAQLYVEDLFRLASSLGLAAGEWERLPAMAPQVNLRVNERRAGEFRARLAALVLDGRPLQYREGEGGHFSLDFGHENLDGKPGPHARLDGEPVELEALGLRNVPIDDRSSTTGYHVPQGCLFVYDPSDRGARHADRPEVSNLEIAPTILARFGVPVPSYMKRPAPIGF